MNRVLFALPALVFFLVTACAGTTTSDADAVTNIDADTIMDNAPDEPRIWPPAPDALGGDRPAAVHVPASYNPDQTWPLVVLLHGRSASGFLQDIFFGLSGLVDEKGFLLVLPDGTPDDNNLPCWNATGTCCLADGSDVDDVGYLLSLVDEASTYFNVDQRRIYFMGHSNGGFMAYRMACEAGDRIAAIMVLAGADFTGQATCTRQHHVGVLHVHGTADKSIDIRGSEQAAKPYPHYESYPSAEASAGGWADRDGCGAPQPGDRLDIVGNLDGAETTTQEWTDCDGSYRVALWIIEGGSHTPQVLNGTLASPALDFLFSQSRP